jgi:UDP-N-acetylmuramoyl-tripeptide--D-alanyl-D-alanine ligase
VGKTSTKEMLRKLLGGQGKTHAAHASFNNHWGVPLTLARMPKDAQFAVIEIGMNHPGEIAPLATMAELDVAIITTVGSAHLAAFSDVVDIAHEKSEIFKGLRPLGAAIFPIDIEQSAILLDHATALGAKIFGFETGEIAQGLRTLRPECSIWRATDVNMTSNMSTMQVSYGALAPLDAQDGQKVGRLMLRISAAGWHFVANALGVLAVAEALGLDLTLAALDLEQWHSVAGRGQVEKIWVDLQGDLNFSLIDDAFNANPASMAASLAVLALYQPQHGVGRVMKGRRIAFLGDMLELGSHEKKLHRAISDLPVIAEIDLIHCVGPRMRALYDALPSKKRGEWAESAYDLIPRAYHLIDAGDIVLIKGSKGSKVSLMVDALRNLGQGEPPIAIRDL